MIAECTKKNIPNILYVINDASLKYKGIIPNDCWHEPYMTKQKLINEDGNGVIHKGISTRQFERSFTISEDIKVKNAELKNGLLNVDLERIIPDEKKPRLININ